MLAGSPTDGFSGYCLGLPFDESGSYDTAFKLWVPQFTAQVEAATRKELRDKWGPWKDAPKYQEPPKGVFPTLLLLDEPEGVPAHVVWNMLHLCRVCDHIFVGELVEHHACYVKWREQATIEEH